MHQSNIAATFYRRCLQSFLSKRLRYVAYGNTSERLCPLRSNS